MNLNRKTKKSRDVIRELIADGLAKLLMAELHRSKTTIYRWAEHWDEVCVDPLERVAGVVLGCLVKFTGLLVQAHQAGCLSQAATAELTAAWEELKMEAESFLAAVRSGVFRCGALFYPLLGWCGLGEMPELAMF